MFIFKLKHNYNVYPPSNWSESSIKASSQESDKKVKNISYVW